MNWYESKDPVFLFRVLSEIVANKELLQELLERINTVCDANSNEILTSYSRSHHGCHVRAFFAKLKDEDIVKIINEFFDLVALDTCYKVHCIKECAKMWQKLADHPKMLKIFTLEGQNVFNDCWMCHYTACTSDDGRLHCTRCLLKWTETRKWTPATTPCERGQYGDWTHAETDEQLTDAASRIVSLCKEALV